MFGWIRRFKERRAARKAEKLAAEKARTVYDCSRPEPVHHHHHDGLGGFHNGMLFGHLLTNHPSTSHHTTIHNHLAEEPRVNTVDRPEPTRREELPAPEPFIPAADPVSWSSPPATESYASSSPSYDSGSSSSDYSGSSSSYDSGSSGGGDW